MIKRMKTSTPQIHIPKRKVAEFCRQHRIVSLSLFGSVLRDDFHEGSDVDILVEFEPGFQPGLSFFRLQREMSVLIGRQVDLRTSAELSPFISKRGLPSAKPQYVRR